MGYPQQFGFRDKLKDMIGLTIEDAAVMRMEWGCTWDRCIFLRFTDGSRGYLMGNDGGGGIMNPHDDVFESRFFTPEEYGIVKADKKRKQDQQERESRERKQRELERLQRELASS